jgi:hypothetical protein
MPLLVLEDADLDEAAGAAAFGAPDQGQFACPPSGSRVEAVADDCRPLHRQGEAEPARRGALGVRHDHSARWRLIADAMPRAPWSPALALG